MPDRIVIEVGKDGWTGQLQLSVSKLDEEGVGSGRRLAGPKFNGSTKPLLSHELDEHDAGEIRAYLDAVFPKTLDARGREIDRLTADLADTREGANALGRRARNAEAVRNAWREAFNELAEAVETACAFDGGVTPPESAPRAAAFDRLDNALTEIRDAIKRSGATATMAHPDVPAATEAQAGLLHYTVNGTGGVCGIESWTTTGDEFHVAFDPADAGINCPSCRMFLAGARTGKSGE